MKVRFALSVGLGAPEPEALARAVTEAEASGFDSLWFSDLPVLPATDPFLAVAFAAAHSRRLKLGVNFVPFGYEPYVFARQVAQLDRLTGGRLLVTLVPGLDQPGERTALGIGDAHRGRLLDATIPQLRAWWAGGSLAPSSPGEPDGEAVALAVRPVQDPLEIWLGGSGPDAISRVGRLADGWLGALMDPARAVTLRTEIEGHATRAGRTIDPEHFGMSIAYARQADDLERAPRLRRRGPSVTPFVPVGASALRALIEQLIDGGLSKFVIRPVAPGPGWSDDLAWLADAVLDLQT
jgi:probable F420-dependent oxidoreductase